MEPVNLIYAIGAIIAVAGAFGAFYAAVRNATFSMLQQRVILLEKDNAKLELRLETIQQALEQQGIHITIDGNLITIKNKDGSTFARANQPRPRATKANQAATKEEQV